MAMKIETKVEINEKAFFDNGELKSAPTGIGEWRGDKICKKTSLDSLLDGISLPEGEYEITVTIEKKQSN